MSHTQATSPFSAPRDVTVKEKATQVVRGDAVEIRVFWHDTLLDVIELCPPRAFHVGDAATSKLPVDFTVPDAAFDRAVILGVDGGAVTVHVPAGATATRRDRDARRTLVDPPLEGASAPLDGPTAVDVRLGSVLFSVRLADRESRAPRVLLGDGDARPLGYFGAAFGLVASFVVALAYFTPPLGLTDDEELDRSRLVLMQQYLDASADREREPEKAPSDETSGGVDAPGEPARGEPGKMGRRDVTAQNRRASGAEPGRELRPATSRAEAIAAAQTFGLVGLLGSGVAAPTMAAWDDAGMGPVAAAGGFFGTEIGEIGGLNGLGPLGIGEGGGGRANQIGLASIGTCHTEGCMGGPGSGISGGRRGPDHVSHVPVLRMAGKTETSGSLPPEIIQRVVRQSFGRFRGCYEEGLRTNPNLAGRVTARFVIARDGSVGVVQNGGADLPDAGVVACVLRAYSGLTFPSPKDGIVRVTYPLSFSPSA